MFLCLPTVSQAHLEFAEQPEASELSRGASIQRKGSGIDRTLLDDKRVGATWFDGRIRRPSDTITWVSPGMTARWLGYLGSQNSWSDGELTNRWDAAATALKGRLTFVVRLAAMPKVDPFEFDNGAPARPEELTNVKFQIRWLPGATTPATPYVRSGDSWSANALGVKVAEIEKYDWAPILNREFYELTPLAPLFLDDGAHDQADDGIRLGDRYGAVYIVTFPLDAAMESAGGFEFDVIRKRRTEKVFFATTKNRLSHAR